MSIRRGIVSGLTVAAFLTAGSALAQEISVEAWEELRELQQEIVDDREDIVAANLDLTEGELEAFLPIYKEYRGASKALHKRTADLIEAYAEHYLTMNEQKAEALMEEWIAIESEELALRKKYAAKTRAVLSAMKTVRFFQIENKLDALMDLDLTLRIPLVE